MTLYAQHLFRAAARFAPVAVPLLLVACVPKALPPDAGTVKPVKEAPSAIPFFGKAKEAETAADKQSGVSWEKFRTVQSQVARARQDAEEANELAESLRKAKTLVAADLERLLKKVGEYKTTIIELGSKAIDLENSLTAERSLRELAAGQYAAAGTALIEKEREAAVLREQLALSGSVADAARKRAAAAELSAAEQAADANRLRGANALKNKLLLGTAGLCALLLVVIWFLLKRKLLLPL